MTSLIALRNLTLCYTFIMGFELVWLDTGLSQVTTKQQYFPQIRYISTNKDSFSFFS